MNATQLCAVQKWELKFARRNLLRVYGTKRRPFDPRRDVIKDYRRQRRGYKWHSHENTKTRRLNESSVRARFASQMAQGDYHLPGPHEYHTYGRQTW